MRGLDTHDAYEKLKESNFNDEQARGIVSIVKQAITGEVATKADLSEAKAVLKADLSEAKAVLKADLAEAKAELKADIVRLDAKLDVKIEEVRTEIADLRTELKTDIATVRTELAKHHTRLIVVMGSIFILVVSVAKALDSLF